MPGPRGSRVTASHRVKYIVKSFLTPPSDAVRACYLASDLPNAGVGCGFGVGWGFGGAPVGPYGISAGGGCGLGVGVGWGVGAAFGSKYVDTAAAFESAGGGSRGEGGPTGGVDGSGRKGGLRGIRDTLLSVVLPRARAQHRYSA